MGGFFYEDSSGGTVEGNGYTSEFSLPSDQAWWQSILSMANTQVGGGLIQGAAGGLSSYLTQQSADDRADKLNSISQDQFAQSLAQKDEQFYAGLEVQQGLLELQQAALDDKIQTRARHNASINKAPGQITKKVTFGSKKE